MAPSVTLVGAFTRMTQIRTSYLNRAFYQTPNCLRMSEICPSTLDYPVEPITGPKMVSGWLGYPHLPQ